MSPIRIMIAEDCYNYARILEDYISDVYPDVSVVGVAENGLKAIQLYQRIKPDAILLDIIMPNLDGLQVLERIRKHDQNTPIFIMSALDNEIIMRKTLNLGADHYFVKPVDVDILVEKIKDMVLNKLVSIQ